ncbi:MAG: hypothetical protein P8182_03750 [Deltaproteobacteria bacterium]
MTEEDRYDFILIRDGTILARVSHERGDEENQFTVELFDVRTGVQLREIHPSFQRDELDRGYLLSEVQASAIIKSGIPVLVNPSVDFSKVVSILDVKQRKLDSVVADSILDQLRVIKDILHDVLAIASAAQEEERFWLSQRLLPLLRKFSGRELAELEETIEWFRGRTKK